MGLLNELWIISQAGVPVYHQCLMENFDETLFGGFISAIRSFTQSFGEHDLKKLELGGSKMIIIISKDGKWLFVGRTGLKENDKKIYQYLTEVSNIFFNRFESYLPIWDQSTDEFQVLDELIDIHNSETPNKQSSLKEQKARGAFL
ncbi:MAG TPA: hypothetical protein VKK79_03345 [Candidatus Lokiarchaeia archaeon]|nr:hypothetical protein [Candidatus Lokiarchaeia archaeon]